MLTEQNKKNSERLEKVVKAIPDIFKNLLVQLGNNAFDELVKSLPNSGKLVIKDIFTTTPDNLQKTNAIIKKDK